VSDTENNDDQVEDRAFRDAGYEETQQGQTEVEAQTPEHERLLKVHPNATSYGPEVNVVVPLEPEEVEEDESEDEEDEEEEEEE
jgi:hypothetical protein